MSRGDELAWFQGFADAARWRFAKTYVESYPYEYTLRRWCEAADFWKAIRCIERWGVVEPFWSTERKYLYDGDRKYWHMGDAGSDDPKERPGLINRTWLEVSRYREQARSLGYEGAELDALAERWKLLLVRARGRAIAGRPARSAGAEAVGNGLGRRGGLRRVGHRPVVALEAEEALLLHIGQSTEQWVDRLG